MPEKTYICERYHRCGVGSLRFKDHKFVTADPEEQRTIEGSTFFEHGTIRLQGAKRDADGHPTGEDFTPPPSPSNTIVDPMIEVLGGGWYKYQGKRYHGRDKLPIEAQGLLPEEDPT